VSERGERTIGSARIVRLANFVTPTSGGLRTSLQHLGEGYRAAGHEPILVVPGARAAGEMTDAGRVITLPAPVVPGTGGYRVLLGRRRVSALLTQLRPDRLEVSDRSTLRWTGAWARRHGVPSIMVSHESLAGLLDVWRVPAQWSGGLADRLNGRTAAAFDTIVATTEWAAAEFRRIGATNLVRVPLGVDLEAYHPTRHSVTLRRTLAADDEVLLVSCTRLSPEKRPDRAIDALAALRAAGVPATLAVAGTGPLLNSLRERAEGLPVRFLGFLRDRREVAALLATADVVMAPGPVETFGLAALEALASGTPVVVSATSALPEVVGAAGVAVDDFAAGVREVLSRPEGARRAAARQRAELFGWPASVAGFLTAHGLPAGVPTGAG
jgi:alpha-1,6-mannosyltransferase